MDGERALHGVHAAEPLDGRHLAPLERLARGQAARELLAAVAQVGFAGLNAEIRAAVAASDGTPLDALRQGCTAYVRFGLHSPAYYRLMFSGPVDKKAEPELEATIHEVIEALLGVLASCRDAGQIRPLPLDDLAALIWAEMHGLVELTLSDRLTAKRLADGRLVAPRLIGALITGLAP
ncbi:MAG: hypothetical protein GEV11_01520 [Streptosporangiales bacterium]|nr:hypothetical protein [Streptosporangiales bacterium]